MAPICLDKSPHHFNKRWADLSRHLGTKCRGQTTSCLSTHLRNHGAGRSRSRGIMAQERTMIGPVQSLVEQVQAFAEQRVDHDPLAHQRIAVLVPCYNEEAAIAKVVADFRAALPAADIYVYDNNSRDRTVEVARAAGAIVRTEPLQGKGRVVRRMFGEIEADIYIPVDGDAAHDAPRARTMAARLLTHP